MYFCGTGYDKDKSDDEWWRALLQSRNDHLRQTALRNAHTLASLLTTLTEPQDRSLAINNPQLAADVKTAWLKRIHHYSYLSNNPIFRSYVI